MPASSSNRWEGIRAATEELNAAVRELTSPEGDSILDKGECQRIVNAAQKILSVAKDPSGLGMEAFSQLTVITANRIFWEWGVFDEIPREGSISYRELAAKVDAELSLISEAGDCYYYAHLSDIQ
jgi:hypothetical protein